MATTTTTMFGEGRVLATPLSPVRQNSFTEEVLRRNVNARVANFTAVTSCAHIEPDACNCIMASNEVMRRYIFAELSQQTVNAGNFNSLFNRAMRERTTSPELRELFRNSAPTEAANRKCDEWKKFGLIALVAIVAGGTFAGFGVFLYTKLIY